MDESSIKYMYKEEGADLKSNPITRPENQL
jgi:hypothetical protein